MTILKNMFNGGLSLKACWLSGTNSGALTGAGEVPFAVANDFNSSGITVASGVITVPAGKWGMFYQIGNTWSSNGVNIAAQFNVYNNTDAAYLASTLCSPFYNSQQVGYQSGAMTGTPAPFGYAFLNYTASKNFSVRIKQYLGAGATFSGLVGGTSDSPSVAIFVDMSTGA